MEPLDKAYALRLPRSVYDQLECEARKQGTSVNQVINDLVAAGLGRRVLITYELVDNKPVKDGDW